MDYVVKNIEKFADRKYYQPWNIVDVIDMI